MEYTANNWNRTNRTGYYLTTTSAAQNTTANPGVQVAEISEVENIVSVVLASILALVILIGNGMVIIAYKMNFRLRTTPNMCFVSLALCDFLVGIFSIPFWAYFTLHKVTEQNLNLYIFYISVDIFNGTASIFQLTAISLERCFSIVSPVRHRSTPNWFHLAIVCSVWVLALASTLLRLLPQHNYTSGDWYNVFMLVVCFSLPVLVMVVSYSLLFRTALKRSRLQIRSNQNLQASWSSQRKTIITLLIVTGLFIIAWSPFFLFLALDRYAPRALPSNLEGRIRLWRFVKWMHYMNSCFNPFIYSYRNKDFSNSFHILFHALIKCNSFEEMARKFRRPTRYSSRNPTRDGFSTTSQTLCQAHDTIRQDRIARSKRCARCAESVKLNTVRAGDIEVSVVERY